MGAVTQVLMALSLASCSGFRIFFPMVMLGLAARSGRVPISPDFDWLTDPQILLFFGILAAFEFWLDKNASTSPVLGSPLGTAFRIASGVICAMAVLTAISELWLLILVGALIGIATVTTFGVLRLRKGRLFISFFEDMHVIVIAWLATHAPWITGPIAIILIVVLLFVQRAVKAGDQLKKRADISRLLG